LAVACLTLLAQEAKVTPLLSKDLTNPPGKRGSDDHRGVSAGQFGPNTSPQCIQWCRTLALLCAFVV